MANWMERARQNFQKSAECTTDVTDDRTLPAVMAVRQSGVYESSDSNVSNVSTSDDRYRDIAIKCLRELQTHHEHNLASGGYDPGGARVSIGDWMRECARTGLSSHRLNQIRPLMLTVVTIEHGYIRELPTVAYE